MALKNYIGDLIQLFRSINDLTHEDFAKFADCSKQLVSAWEAARAEITVSSVVLLARRLGIDPRWLLLGDRDTERHSLKSPFLIHHIPLMTKVQIMRYAMNRQKGPHTSLHTVFTVIEHSGTAFAMACLDDAMSSSYRRGDHLILDSHLKPSPNSHVVATAFKDGSQSLTYRKSSSVGFISTGAAAHRLSHITWCLAHRASHKSPSRPPAQPCWSGESSLHRRG